MANTTNIQVNFNTVVESDIITGYTIKASGKASNTLSVNATISSITQSMNTGSWIMIDTGSVGTVQSVYVKNLSTGSMLDTANNSGGTQKVSLIPYNAGFVFYPSGSQGLWGRYCYVSGSTGSGSIQVNAVGY